jgi:hypothetical protein
MSGSSLNQEELNAHVAEAEANGFETVRADDSTLLLDLDNEYALAQYDRVLPTIMQHFGPVGIDRWHSKSGNTHIRVRLGTPQPWAVRYALQAALGSDGVRDVLSVLQMQNGCDEASILFKPTEASANLQHYNLMRAA